ncbi:hypothetical protein BDZ91DRAFT_791253 [Kalaharituber pfeilii]|nr:hypothetical protein BDZ91DRAFT_791253 [Kalaharituber pfeilii]
MGTAEDTTITIFDSTAASTVEAITTIVTNTSASNLRTINIATSTIDFDIVVITTINSIGASDVDGGDANSNKNLPGGSCLTKGALAAIVGVSSLIGVLLIAMSIRIWRQRKRRIAALPSHFQDIGHLGSSLLGSNGPNSGPSTAGPHGAELAAEDLMRNPREEVPVYKADLSATPVPVELAG